MKPNSGSMPEQSTFLDGDICASRHARSYKCEYMRWFSGRKGNKPLKKINIIMYHYVRDLKNSRYPGIKGLDYALFKQQILWLKQRFLIIAMEEFISACYKPGEYDFPDNTALLTFDDGYMDHYTFVMPILKEHNIQGSFFIPGKTFAESSLLDVNKIHFILASENSDKILLRLLNLLRFYRGQEFDFPSNEELYQTYAVPGRFDSEQTVFIKQMLQTILPERLRTLIASQLFSEFVSIEETKFARELYMNYDQIKCMKSNGMYIGVHGYDHHWLGDLPLDKAIDDIEKGLSSLSEVVDKDSWVMNYPYGSYSQDVITYVSQKGCKLGLTTNVAVADLNDCNPYELPRLDTNDFPPKSDNYITLQ